MDEVCAIRHHPSARTGVRTQTHTHTTWQNDISGRDYLPLVVTGRLVDTPRRCVASDRNDPSLVARFLKYFVYYTWVFPKSDSEAEHGPRQFLTGESETTPPAAELTG